LSLPCGKQKGRIGRYEALGNRVANLSGSVRVEAGSAERGNAMIAWLLWLLHGRPRIPVEMSAEWMELAGFPSPEVGHFDVPTYKYAKVMRTLHDRAMRELERRALEPSPRSEEEAQKLRAEFQQKLEKQRTLIAELRANKQP
jgi:hypothetical protein